MEQGCPGFQTFSSLTLLGLEFFASPLLIIAYLDDSF